MSLTLHQDFLKLPASERYLLAISGGRDSIALLHLLVECGYQNLILCHLDHGLRGDESTEDAQFVTHLANQLELEFEIGHTNVQKRIEDTGESMELAARNSRHRFFAHCAQKYACSKLLLAHHADDQVETILFNLLRGSAGLRGMQHLSTLDLKGAELTLYRPLLKNPRSAIDSYLASRNISYREDSSNTEAIATRNQIRHEAVPVLERIMEREIREPLLRAEEIFREKEDALLHILSGVDLKDPQGRLFLPKLKELHPAMQRMAIHEYLKDHQVPESSHDLLTRCLNLIEDEAVAKINLPGNCYFRRKEKRLFIDQDKK